MLSVSLFRLMALKEKIMQQRKQLEELDKNMYVACDERIEEDAAGAESNLTNAAIFSEELTKDGDKKET